MCSCSSLFSVLIRIPELSGKELAWPQRHVRSIAAVEWKPFIVFRCKTPGWMPSRRWNGTPRMLRNTRRLHLFFPALPILPASKSNLPAPTLPQGLPGQENQLPASLRLKSNRRARSKVGRQQEEHQTVPWDSDYLRRDELRWHKGTEQVRWFKSVLKAPQQRAQQRAQQRRWAACGNKHTCTCYKHPHKEQSQIFVLSNLDHDFGFFGLKLGLSSICTRSCSSSDIHLRRHHISP